MAETRFISFDEASELLGLGEDQLHDLVAANELRAFRVNREMRFKETDVKALATQRSSDSGVVSIDDADIVMVSTPPEPASAGRRSGPVDVLDLDDEPVPSESVTEAVPVETASGATEEVELVDLDDEQDGATVVVSEDELSVEEVDLGSGETEMALEISDTGTQPVLEAPTSDGLGTEEIIFEDEDLALGGLDDDVVGTQELTVREGAIGTQELTVAEDAVQSDTGVGEAAVAPAPRASARGSVRRSGRASMRRSIQVQRAPGGAVWSVLLVLMALMMVYPGLLFINIAWQGFVTGNDSFTAGEMDHDGMVEEYGPLFVHKFFQGFLDVEMGGARPAGWWGMPANTPLPTQVPTAADLAPAAPAPEAAAAAAPAAAETPAAAPAAEEQNAGGNW